MATSGKQPLTNNSSDGTFCCPICLEEVRNPKYLACLHTFCESCIQTYISSTATCHDSLNTKTINCPVCRKCIDAPRKDISNEEWATSLPENKLIVSMWLKTKNADKQLCKFCEGKEKSVPATYWCKPCMATICDDCKALHEFVPILQNHKIVNIADSKDLDNEYEVEELCPEHKGKTIDAFCHLHQKLCCCICLAKHHILCEGVEVIADMAVEKEQNDVHKIISSFSDLQKCIENMQLKNRSKIADLNSMKQEMCSGAEKAVQEIKKMIDDAFTAWIKRFEQTHADSVGNLDVATDELKRFSTTVHETRILLQSVLKNGSPKQLFITKQNQLARIVDHFNRLKSQDIWNFPEGYTQQDTRYLQQLLNDNKFEDVKLSKSPSETVETLLQYVSKASCSNLMKRNHETSNKDWMKVTFKLVSQITNLPERSYYGLFVHDTHIILSLENTRSLRIFDVSEPNVKCIHTEKCPSVPYGMCHSRVNETLNEVYVSFQNSVVLYSIDIRGKVKFTKLQTISLKLPMKTISCGLTAIFSANDDNAFVCSPDFTSEYTTLIKKEPSVVLFLSSSSKSDFCTFTKDGCVMVVNRNFQQIFQSKEFQDELRGLTFDLHDNILVCCRTNKLKQIKWGGNESRDIELAGISDAYNVVLHPSGEKVLVLDFDKKCCIYQVL